MYRGSEWDLAEYCRRRGYSVPVVEGGLEYLVSSWERTVMKIETGYTGMILESGHELNGRRIAHELWPLTAAEQQIRFGSRLEAADQRFAAATERIDESFSLAVRKNPDRYPPIVRWLYYRVPKGKPPDW
jgi:hypothetical protein